METKRKEDLRATYMAGCAFGIEEVKAVIRCKREPGARWRPWRAQAVIDADGKASVVIDFRKNCRQGNTFCA